MRLKPIDPGERLSLRDADAKAPKKAPSSDELRDLIDEETNRISDLQRVFYADGRRALLIVLQGRDASGKDGTIRQVFSAVNPQGCQVTSFKAPTELERRHDFLWRVHQQVPARGMFGIFNRSHYEEVLVPRVRGGMRKRECSARYEQINDFEHMLSANGTVILKFFLHVSKDEQKARLEERLADEAKNWKFQPGDLDDRAKWNDYTSAYSELLRTCSTTWAPWYLVPSDDKKLRTWLIARCIADRLADLNLEYPAAAPETLALKID
jgi:PPK2 family polyphosphate:nucleotide phosphotransferase